MRNFGSINFSTQELTTKDGGYKIAFSEIIGWNQASD